MSRRPQLERMSEGAWRVPGVEVFASGTHRDKEYTPADIDQMVANFNRFSTPRPGKKPLLRVPAVLGHEEDQDLLERSDLPAAAWGLRAFARNGKDEEGKPQRILCVDLEDAPPAVARLLHGKAYRTVSAEVYDEPPDGIPGKGKMLRRIALLGGDIPQVKTLADIPTPEPMHERFAAGRPVLLRFREARQKSAPGASKTWVCFSEVTPMGRDKLLRKLQSLGFDVSRITDAVGDEVLEEMCRALDGKQGQEQMADAGGEQMPQEQAQAQQMADLPPVDQQTSQQMADGTIPAQTPAQQPAGGAVTPFSGAKKVVAHYTEQQIAAIVSREVSKALQAHVGGTVAELKKFHEETVASQKKAAVDSLIEQLFRDGKLPPAERESERQGLMMLDASTLHKFSEGGKVVQKSAFDHRVEQLKRRPSLFGEKFRCPANAPGSANAELEKVQKFSESPQLAVGLKAAGRTPADFVNGFKEAQKLRPAITAVEYGVPEHHAV